jgi:hypothetical protein
MRQEWGVLMGSTITALITVAALGGWHLRTRRHPNWSVCPDGRFYITIGYPAVAVAVYWLMEASSTTGLEWALGNLWALGAMIAFVRGFNELHALSQRHHAVARTVESIHDTVDGSVLSTAR